MIKNELIQLVGVIMGGVGVGMVFSAINRKIAFFIYLTTGFASVALLYDLLH